MRTALDIRRAGEREVAPSGDARAYRWTVVGPERHPLAAALRAASRDDAPEAVAVLLGRTFHQVDNRRLLRAIRTAVARGSRLAVVHLGAGGGSLARTAAIEHPGLSCVVAELTGGPTPAAVRAATALVAAASPVTAEVRVDRDGRLSTTDWHPTDLPAAAGTAGPAGTVLVTGGLGGLGLRVAAVLACRHGLHPILADTATPERLGTAARWHLDRIAATTGVTVRRADVSDGAAMRQALAGTGSGPLVGVVHCAGLLRGGPVTAGTAAGLTAVQAAKVDGLRHALEVVDRHALRRVLVFGSITAERPHRSLGAYALANELLRRCAVRLAADLPAAATLVAEWSIWSGAGMAHGTPGAVAAARRLNLPPVPLGPGMAAVDALWRLPAAPGRAQRLLIAGR
ncbi:KR domain-containing protein [Micromonospora sp. NPDC005220]|uniref:KR domain-containing protein n=1 Tax=Micromonospora sp. NPDC005220 TaxID=3155589 RepID=UPI0033B80319